MRATKSGRKKRKGNEKKRKGTCRGETALKKKADPQKETSRENEMIRCEGIVYGDGGGGT